MMIRLIAIQGRNIYERALHYVLMSPLHYYHVAGTSTHVFLFAPTH